MICNKREFADLVGYSPRQVSAWITAGMPVVGGGRKGVALQIDTAVALGWLLDREGGGGARAGKIGEERLRWVAAKARLAELELRQKNAELLPIGDVESLMQEATATFAGQRRSMGSRLAGRLAGMSDPKQILKVLNSENDRILKTVSAAFRDGAKAAEAK